MCQAQARDLANPEPKDPTKHRHIRHGESPIIQLNNLQTAILKFFFAGAGGGGMARARWAQRPLRGTPWEPKHSYCHQMITQTNSNQKARTTSTKIPQMTLCHVRKLSALGVKIAMRRH